ncbi:MAG: metal-dependent hydrolase [Bryobacteraceae bacterium]|nr:metal-dependent hydrolase [Bryobacteraceae bacterium]
MDNLTHTLTGLMLSRAGLRHFHPRASLLLMLAANAPDSDVVSAAGGVATYFQYHRGITHALVFVPIMALLPVLIVWAIYRKHPPLFLRAWLLSMAGVASHLLLDLTNPYGIRLFLPWDTSWPMLSITSVVDVWIWAVLLFAVAAPVLSRLVSSEIGARSSSGQGIAVAALLLMTVYDTGRWFLHQRAVSVLEAQNYGGEVPLRVFALPDKLNPFQWDGVIETQASFAQRRIFLTGVQEDSPPKISYKPESSLAIEAAARDPLVRNLREFSKAPLWTVTPAPEVENATKVGTTDLFFGFTATAIVDSTNRVVSSQFHF